MFSAISQMKIKKKWGNEGCDALVKLTHSFENMGFRGPLTLKEPGFISFYLDPCSTVRVIINITNCGEDVFGCGLFDVVITFWSNTIFNNIVETDPWYPVGAGYEKWHQGYVPCLVVRLSHLKWAQVETKENPSWLMNLSGVSECIKDFQFVAIPILNIIRSDEGIKEVMLWAKNYQKPKWVLSDKPGIRNLDMLITSL